MRDIGPELISGAADNDPTNMGTAAVVGAQTGYRLCWVTLAVAPLLAVVLNIAAQVATATRSDLQSLTLSRYGRRVAGFLMVSVVIVNLVTIAADLKAGAAGIGLLAGVNSRWLILPLAVALTALLLAGKYGQLVQLLRFVLPGFLAFTVAAVLARPDWPQLLAGSLVPRLSLRPDQISGGLALLGTTLTSYVYVWETIERGLEEAPEQEPARHRQARARAGAGVGAVFTSLILWSMLATSAATLGRTHQSISSAQDAAPVLRPLAGIVRHRVVRGRAGRLGGRGPPGAGGHHRLRGRRPVPLAARPVPAHRPGAPLLCHRDRVRGARGRPGAGQRVGAGLAGRGQRARRDRHAGRAGPPGPPGPGSRGHGRAADLPGAGGRRVGRHRRPGRGRLLYAAKGIPW